MHFSPRRQGGAIAIMVALAMLVLLAVVGLVIDGGLAYLVKARLNAAVDSAALAAARAVPSGNNKDEQIANARAAAADFFAANIPSGYMLSQPKLLSTNVDLSTGGTAVIDVRAEAPMPVSVMQVLGFTALTPTAAAQTIRKDLDMAFVVDTSGSLSSNAAAVQASAKSFLNKLNVTQDRVALIHFASGVKTDNPINATGRGFNRASMNTNINAFKFDGGTSSVEGLREAREELNSVTPANRSSMRVIVFFSDGAPTSFGTYLTFNTPTDCIKAGALDSAGGGLGLLDLNITADTPIQASCTLKSPVYNSAKTLPPYYTLHVANSWLTRNADSDLPIVTGGRRPVTNDLSSTKSGQNIDRAARNLAEGMAAKARDEGIFVFTLGMGAALKNGSVYDPDTGESILKCMANVADSRCYNPNKPVGMYCYAATEADLTPCFSRLASAILRISK